MRPKLGRFLFQAFMLKGSDVRRLKLDQARGEVRTNPYLTGQFGQLWTRRAQNDCGSPGLKQKEPSSPTGGSDNNHPGT